MAVYNLIATITVGSVGATSILFSGIPQTYTDLEVVASLRGSDAVNYQTNRMKINGSTSNLSTRVLFGTGSAASSAYVNTYLHIGNTGGTGATSSVFSSHSIYIPNYTSSAQKSIRTDSAMENNNTSFYVNTLTAGLWSQTAAITSLDIYPENGSWVQFSSASLYGIKNS